ncbi:lanthionine synthetase LanC family protein [Herbidospora cretacea]|uniref:lanthionine synthetase LanC family protein n=1 Tax=Herbidospora cretacea TaxID=28444 RepID=UPI0004C2C1ED|nr:lanthionine synthetase LanC family protein [Herbidospora cretacea]
MATDDNRETVAAALAAVTVSATYDLAWFGEVVDTIRPLPDDAMMREAAGSFVSRLLYRGCYLFGRPRREVAAFRESIMEGLPSTRSARFVNAAVYAGAHVAPTKRRLPLVTGDAEPLVDLEGVRVRLSLPGPAEHVEVHIPGVSVTKSPGFVLFRSPHGQPAADGQRLVRLYWNMSAAGAVGLIDPLTRIVGGLPFHFKVVHADADWPERADSAVLYIGHDDLARVWPALRDLHRRLLPAMRPYVPALTRRAGLGLGVAEDPGGGESYGMFVCERIAEGLMRAHAEGSADRDLQLAFVAEAFEKAGRSLAVPHATPEVARLLDGLTGAAPAPGPVAPGGLTGEAERLARRMAADALVHGDRCTWLKPHPDVGGRAGWVPMSADVYDGTAGMALFLSQLGDPAFTRLAAQAARQALATASDLPGPGLYSGTAGTGLAVALAGHAIGDADLVERGFALVDAAARDALTGAGPADVIDGTAGALLAVLTAHHLGNPTGLAHAADLGATLIGKADDTGGALSWTPGFVGYAHGAAGCALALAELAEATGETAFLEAAGRAVAYERTWFHDGNWRDARTAHERGPGGDPTLEPDINRYDWCYGAPGIALTRGRLDPREAGIGFAAARRAAATHPALVYDMCLCHGAAGIAEILSLAPADHAEDGDGDLAREMTRRALAAHHDDLAWPRGHGLMLGAAGVGLAALRRDDPAIVSPLHLTHLRGDLRGRR